MDVVYGYDDERFAAETKKDIITRENEEMIDRMNKLATSTPNPQ